jgi:hypothetical protein
MATNARAVLVGCSDLPSCIVTDDACKLCTTQYALVEDRFGLLRCCRHRAHALAVPFSLIVICILLDGSNQWHEEDVTFAKLTSRTARLASEAWNRWTDTDANAPENALKEVLEFAEHCDLPEEWGEGAYCTGCTVVEQR